MLNNNIKHKADHWRCGNYSPQGPTDAVPSAPVSISVALADKIDTLTGFWLIDEKPTGSKDPFALRRAALGIIRLVIDNEINEPLECILAYGFYLNSIAVQSLEDKSQTKYIDLSNNSLEQIFELIGEGHSKKTKGILRDLISFFHDRLKVYLRDQNINHDVIDACLAMPNNTNFSLFAKRAKVLQAAVCLYCQVPYHTHFCCYFEIHIRTNGGFACIPQHYSCHHYLLCQHHV